MVVENVYLIKEKEIATLFFNRPNKRNAINYSMWHKLSEILEDIDNDSRIKVLILRGVDDSAFSSGADIKEFGQLRSNDIEAKKYSANARKAIDNLLNLRKPTIALIQGYCIGGGNEIALACDFRFTDSTGRFGITPSKLGIIYGLSTTKMLFDLVGPSFTKDILMSARIIEAREAIEKGLVDRIYSQKELENETYNFANLLCNRSQITIRGAKMIIQEILNGVKDDTPEIKEMVLNAYNQEDYKEGVKAFEEKRNPHFTYS